MTRDDIIRMAREAGATNVDAADPQCWAGDIAFETDELERFYRAAYAAGAAAECEKVAQWMIRNGYATGHGDTIEDLLEEMEWQVREREREACARLCEKMETYGDPVQCWLDQCAAAIRARGET